MAKNDWAAKLRGTTKTALTQDGKRKVHYTFDDGDEMVEEYDLRNFEILVRKWQKKGALGGKKDWEVEIGDPATIVRGAHARNSLEFGGGIVETVDNPILVRSDKRKQFQWRIRNLPYSLDNFNVRVENRQVVVRTKNKKYFKKISIPDMDRFALPLSGENLSFAHANNTLILTYEKPVEILRFEEAVRQEIRNVKGNRDGDVEACNPS